MMSNYRIVLADDHLMFRQGIKKILGDQKGLEVIGEAGDGYELLKILKYSKFDLVILDISMPKLGGIEATSQIKKEWPGSKILILSMYKNKEYIINSICGGADGYVFKGDSDKDLLSAIDVIHNGGFYISPNVSFNYQAEWFTLLRRRNFTSKSILSKREVEVLNLVAKGFKSKDIAKLLFISKRTIDVHRANIFKKLGLNSIADLTSYAISRGYIND